MNMWFYEHPKPYVSGAMTSETNPFVGMVRYNSMYGRFEINTGSSWTDAHIGQHAQTTSLFEDNMNWVMEQRRKEQLIQDLAKKHPAVQNALEAVEKAKEQLEIIAALSQEQI